MPRIEGWRAHALALAAYVVIALAFSWPLPLHLTSHLTGVPDGDTGVYVWNQWVFRHELVELGRLPYQTDTLFGPGNPANLSLHNYTLFQNLLALPLIPAIGVVATFNVIYLLMTVLTGYCTFLLARRVSGAALESWLAGLLFAWSPALVARGTVHFSLVAAAPLAVFLLLLIRLDGRYRLRDALAFGAAAWWAASTDVYYAVYCVLLTAVVLTSRVVMLRRAADETAPRLRRALNVAGGCLAALVAALVVTGGWDFTLLGQPVHVRTLYTPVLALTAIVLVRLALRYRVSIAAVKATQVWALARFAAVAGVAAAVLLSPVLYAVAQRLLAGDFDTPRIFWRSSPPGVDALALLLPNPHHPLLPSAFVEWLKQRKLEDAENIAALPWFALVTIAVAAWAGWRAPRRWVVLSAVFGLLAMGPFLVVAGMNTHVPGPWALLRYLPVVGLARTPARFSVVLALVVAVLFGLALTWLGRRYPSRRRQLLMVASGLLLFELLPAPRALYPAAVPSIYAEVAAAPSDAVLLEIPWGIRDGASSVGNFSARTQFFQTAHGKTIMGGYLSRVAGRRVAEVRRNPVLNALAVMSENTPLSPAEEQALIEQAPALLIGNNIQFVVIDRLRTSPRMRETVAHAFRLCLVSVDGQLELHRPSPSGVRTVAGLPCRPPTDSSIPRPLDTPSPVAPGVAETPMRPVGTSSRR